TAFALPPQFLRSLQGDRANEPDRYRVISPKPAQGILDFPNDARAAGIAKYVPALHSSPTLGAINTLSLPNHRVPAGANALALPPFSLRRSAIVLWSGTSRPQATSPPRCAQPRAQARRPTATD